ncbi:hypothetical protein J3459_008183 [Metarhizium acridum]|uniref:uncharacterized protein n=1 Tax=Metarhizium acridum TaxID=92637 RepID=UPI001C6B6946|nr:hypothetical protein J3458_000730 [Metarhizium acridum]KAG8426373.1 hypothetical protein J3459_008183 [Metarhizium acridum]
MQLRTLQTIFSTLAHSTPCTSRPFSEAEDDDTPHSISSESQPSEIGSSGTFPREAMKDMEVVDPTGDDLYASPEPSNPEPRDDASNGIVVTQRLIFVDLIQDDGYEVPTIALERLSVTMSQKTWCSDGVDKILEDGEEQVIRADGTTSLGHLVKPRMDG